MLGGSVLTLIQTNVLLVHCFLALGHVCKFVLRCKNLCGIGPSSGTANQRLRDRVKNSNGRKIYFSISPQLSSLPGFLSLSMYVPTADVVESPTSAEAMRDWHFDVDWSQ